MSFIHIALLGTAVFFGAKAMAGEEKKDPISSKFDDLFKKYASQNGLDWKFLKAISMNESTIGENPRVKRGIENPKDIKGSTSSDGKSWGLMQMTVETARDYDPLASAEKLNNPEYNVRLAASLLFSLKRQFNGVPRDMAMAYNHGAGNQKRFIQLEKSGQLKPTDFPAGRAYWEKTKKNYSLIFGVQLA